MGAPPVPLTGISGTSSTVEGIRAPSAAVNGVPDPRAPHSRLAAVIWHRRQRKPPRCSGSTSGSLAGSVTGSGSWLGPVTGSGSRPGPGSMASSGSRARPSATSAGNGPTLSRSPSPRAFRPSRFSSPHGNVSQTQTFRPMPPRFPAPAAVNSPPAEEKTHRVYFLSLQNRDSPRYKTGGVAPRTKGARGGLGG